MKMKISELIKKLDKLKKIYGDTTCLVGDHRYYCRPIEEIYASDGEILSYELRKDSVEKEETIDGVVFR